MIRIIVIFIFLCVQSCTKVDLVPSTADELISKIKQSKGEKAVLLNIWALWCVPCVEEFPMIVDLGVEHHDLEVVFISADFDDQVGEVRDFLDRNGVGPVSYIKKEKDESFILGIHPSWTGSLPFTIVYAKNSGNIVDLWEGEYPESRFRTAIEVALKS
jgi:thiol-disulfide isomerase/thioredoxin|tara:strand:- start:457 stop:933 length:477 start_codon:yes stop_codon:yes gene_type:complete